MRIPMTAAQWMKERKDSDEAPASVHGDEETRHVQSRRINRREKREDSDADLSTSLQ